MHRTTIAHYRLLSALGSGGMGEVYLAEDTRLGRKVALKILPDRTASDADARTRLIREAQTAATLDHENICTVYEVGHADDISFIAMQYIDGETLAARLVRERFDVRTAASVGGQIALALATAHDAGVIHRDIKPQNIMLTARGLAKVLDFGLAKFTHDSVGARDANTRQSLTAAGALVGTTAYMSPEQLRSEVLDGRSDLFSLGTLLFEMVSGRHPFRAATTAGTLAAILERDVPTLGVTDPLATEYERIVRKCLEKDKEHRYQSARDLLVDLRQLDRDSSSLVSNAPRRLAAGSRSTRRWLALVTGCAVLAIAVFLLLQTRGAGPTSRSIAILPFDASDSSSAYLGDGVSESLINTLSQLPQLKVMARTTTFRYRGSAVDVRQIRRDLGVDHIVSGSVTQQGDVLVVQADLTDATDGTQIWGQRYQRQLADLFKVQEEIAREIASNLRIRLSGRQEAGLAKRYTANVDAYRHYLLGRSHAQQRTITELQKAVEYYKQAIALDARYALAYAGLTDAHILLVARGQVSPTEGRRLAQETAARALSLDAELAESHAALGQTHVYMAPYDFVAGDRALRRAVELSPSWAIAHQYLGVSLLEQSRTDDAIREWETAGELDPLSPFISRLVAHAYLVKRDYPRALALERQANQLGPPFALHSEIEIYLQNNAIAEVQSEIARLAPTREGDPYLLFATATIAAHQQRRAEALAIAAKLEALGTSPASFALLLAKIHLTLGDYDAAFELLERGLTAEAIPIVYPGAPVWDQVRDNPRFQDILRRMGVPSR